VFSYVHSYAFFHRQNSPLSIIWILRENYSTQNSKWVFIYWLKIHSVLPTAQIGRTFLQFYNPTRKFLKFIEFRRTHEFESGSCTMTKKTQIFQAYSLSTKFVFYSECNHRARKWAERGNSKANIDYKCHRSVVLNKWMVGGNGYIYLYHLWRQSSLPSQLVAFISIAIRAVNYTAFLNRVTDEWH
jgi:hypothetical protein